MVVLQRALAGLATLAASCLVTEAALAHPHVFAEGKVEIVGTPEGKLAAVHNIWRMDELFSSTVLVEFDKNADGVLDGAELDEVGRTVKDSIAEWDFYIYVETGARHVKMTPPAEIRALWDDNQLLLFFQMKPVEPVDLVAGKLTIANFDESFYTAFDFKNADDFQLIDMPKSCVKTFIVPDEDAAAKEWTDKMAGLGPDETIPDDGVNYSQILAARLEVACAPTG